MGRGRRFPTEWDPSSGMVDGGTPQVPRCAAMIDLDHARTRLLEERAHLQRQLDDVEHDRTDGGPIEMLGGDAAADTTAVTAELNLRSDLLHSIGEIDQALRRIDTGTYGIDEETGEPIDPERLDAIPTARTNIR